MTTEARTYPLPSAVPYHPHTLGYNAAVSRLFGRKPFIIPAGKTTFTIRFNPPVTPENDWYALVFSTGEDKGFFLLSKESMSALLHMAEPSPHAGIEPEVALLLLELLFENALNSFEEMSGQVVHLSYITTAAEALRHTDINCRTGFQAASDTNILFEGVLCFETAFLPLLHSLAPPLAVHFPDPPVTLALTVGSVALTPGQLSVLAPGFGLVLGPGDSISLSITAAEALSASVNYVNNKIIFHSNLSPMTQNLTANRTDMTDTPPSPETDPSSLISESTLDQLQIPLTFELARITVSLAELRTMGEGHVIDIGPLNERAVSIIANGRRIGEGELVTIGQSAAVRITRIITS